MRITRLVCLILGVFFITSCERSPIEPTSEPQSRTSHAVSKSNFATINGFDVQYLGRSFKDGATTFSYFVVGAGATEELTRFILETPTCGGTPTRSTPSGASGPALDSDSGVFGLRWDLPLKEDDLNGRVYTVEYKGDVPEGLVRTGVRVGATDEVAARPGACGGFHIQGSAFIDPSLDGVRDPITEPGILPGVTVFLTDEKGNVQTSTTDENGAYAFFVLDGDYTLSIPAATVSEDFNEELAASFDPTSPLSVAISGGPDLFDQDFGFDPQAEELIEEVVQGSLASNGRDIRWWKRQLNRSLHDHPQAIYSNATMTAMLQELEALFFEDPFQLTDGDEIRNAIVLLRGNPRTLEGQLLQELFTLELNHVAGRGLFEALDLQAVLISWGESLLQVTPAVTKFEIAAGSTDDQNSAKVLFSEINGRGGGDDPIGD